jgi:uncharacterized protein (TIGR03067 family)
MRVIFGESEPYMTRTVTVLAVLLMTAGTLAQGTPAGKQQPLDRAFAPLQGSWVINDINGQAPPAMLLVFKGDQYEQHVNDVVVERGAIKLNPKQKPMAIDLVITEGQDANKLQVGIVEVTGDKMRLNLAQPASTTRPKTFDAEPGMLLVNLTKRK